MPITSVLRNFQSGEAAFKKTDTHSSPSDIETQGAS